jgi:hypothetical protein
MNHNHHWGWGMRVSTMYINYDTVWKLIDKECLSPVLMAATLWMGRDILCHRLAPVTTRVYEYIYIYIYYIYIYIYMYYNRATLISYWSQEGVVFCGRPAGYDGSLAILLMCS